MAIRSMHDLLLEELRDLYSAERLAVRAYPRIRKAIQTDALRQAVEEHLEQTKEQIERLNRVFESVDAKSRAKTCHAMEGLIEEAQEHLEADLEPELLEVILVADLQKMEHYEIASYGSAKAHAEALGLTEAAELLEETLEEEKQTDARLNQLAIDEINPQALEQAEEEAGEEGEEEAEPQARRQRSSRRTSARAR
ncbi:MAG: DUF892 family protein [Alphaproteobacteria bacterium]|nr:DUF892 family protein [Alphaproteobacteria bacterium]